MTTYERRIKIYKLVKSLKFWEKQNQFTSSTSTDTYNANRVRKHKRANAGASTATINKTSTLNRAKQTTET